MKFILFGFFTHMGGAQQATSDFLCHLHNRGYEVEFVDAYGELPEHEALIKKAGVKYTALHRQPRYPKIGLENRPVARKIKMLASIPNLLVVSYRLRLYLKETRPDAVIVISEKGLRILDFSSRGLNSRIIFWCHGKQISQSVFQGKYGKRVDMYFCLSETARAASIANGAPSKKISILPNAIDADLLLDKSKKPLLNSLPDSNKPIKLLVPATLIPLKGQDCSVRALGSLVRDGYDAVLYLAGDSPNGDLYYSDKLSTIAKQEGVLDRVYFLGWRTDIPQIMRQSTAVLLLSHSEGMPLSIIEALTLGCPVIATPVGSIPEMLENENLGKIVEIDNYLECKAAVLDIVNANKYGCKVKASNSGAIERYSVRNQMKLFELGVDDDS
ncbi:glycosyltransferase [Thermodesulfobacteriota bacterium]